MNAAPKYQQLAEDLRRQIALGELPPDAQLPTEWQLVAQHGLSRGTVRQALTVLEQAGLIRREQGRGMFVNPPRVRLPAFTLTEPDGGESVSSLRTPVAEAIPAPDEAAGRLGIPVGTPVFHVVQIRYAGDAPVMHEERYFAVRWYPPLLDEPIGQTPMHWILVHKAKLPLVRLSHIIDVRAPTRAEAALLHTGADESVFTIDRLSFTRDGERVMPAVWYRALCRGSDYQLRAEFQNNV